MLAEYGYLPTRIPIGEGRYSVECENLYHIMTNWYL